MVRSRNGNTSENDLCEKEFSLHPHVKSMHIHEKNEDEPLTFIIWIDSSVLLRHLEEE